MTEDIEKALAFHTPDENGQYRCCLQGGTLATAYRALEKRVLSPCVNCEKAREGQADQVISLNKQITRLMDERDKWKDRADGWARNHLEELDKRVQAESELSRLKAERDAEQKVLDAAKQLRKVRQYDRDFETDLAALDNAVDEMADFGE